MISEDRLDSIEQAAEGVAGSDCYVSPGTILEMVSEIRRLHGLLHDTRSRAEQIEFFGDALAGAAQDALADIRDRSPVKQPLARALSSWVAAVRDATSGPAPQEGGPPP